MALDKEGNKEELQCTPTMTLFFGITLSAKIFNMLTIQPPSTNVLATFLNFGNTFGTESNPSTTFARRSQWREMEQ